MGLIGSLFALPFEIQFFVTHFFSRISKPVMLLTLVCVLSNPSAAWRKLQLFAITIQYLVFCNDKKWKTPKQDPASFFEKKDDDAGKVERKTVIFVRHGESTWNDTFNKGADRSKINFILYFIPNLFYAIAYEWYFWVMGQATESWFFDAPLSVKGKRQADGVKKFLQQDPAFLTPKEKILVTKLRGGDIDAGKDETTKGCSSQLVSSNLRRAIATMGLGFQDRLEAKYKDDKILLLPALQEISRNPDALSITPAQGSVVPAWTDPRSLRPIYESQIDTSKHTGNKPVNSNGLKRLQEFCKIVFEDIEKECVIAAGHSLWFRSFFRTFLPHSNTHVAKKKKLVNGGVVGFTLERIEVGKGHYEYMIDPTSIALLHGGF